MKRKNRAPWIAIPLITLLASGVAAAQKSPTAFLKSVDRKLEPLVGDTEKNQAKILAIVNKMMDFPTLCQSSLGKHWQDRSADEKKEFTETLHALIEKNLVKRLGDTRDNEITYQAENVSGDKGSVVTLVSTGDDPRADKVEIEYKLVRKGKKWKVVDLITDGVSLVSNYRSQFNKIITEDGWAALMKKMKDKLAE